MKTSTFKNKVIKFNEYVIALGNDSTISFADDLSFAFVYLGASSLGPHLVKYLVRVFDYNFRILSVGREITILIMSDK